MLFFEPASTNQFHYQFQPISANAWSRIQLQFPSSWSPTSIMNHCKSSLHRRHSHGYIPPVVLVGHFRSHQPRISLPKKSWTHSLRFDSLSEGHHHYSHHSQSLSTIIIYHHWPPFNSSYITLTVNILNKQYHHWSSLSVTIIVISHHCHQASSLLLSIMSINYHH